MRRRWPLPVPVLALLAVLGGLLVGPAPPALACSVAVRVEYVPVSQATAEDRRWALESGPDTLRVLRPDPLPPGAVVFEGAATATGTRPSRNAAWGSAGAPTWTFRVEQVLRGEVAPEVVVVGGDRGSPCGHLGPRYQVGVRQRVAAVADPATGELRGLVGSYAELLPDQASIRPTPVPVPTTPVPPTAVPLPVRPPAPTAAPAPPARPPGSGGAYATRIALVFLAEVGVLGVVLTGAGLYLRSRELDLEERELALRERQAGRAPPAPR